MPWHALGSLGMPWVALGCLGMPWDSLGCLGMPWVALGCLGMPWDAWGCLGMPWVALGSLEVLWCLSLARSDFAILGLEFAGDNQGCHSYVEALKDWTGLDVVLGCMLHLLFVILTAFWPLQNCGELCHCKCCHRFFDVFSYLKALAPI